MCASVRSKERIHRQTLSKEILRRRRSGGSRKGEGDAGAESKSRLRLDLRDQQGLLRAGIRWVKRGKRGGRLQPSSHLAQVVECFGAKIERSCPPL